MITRMDGSRNRAITLRMRGCVWDLSQAEFGELIDDLESCKIRADEIERWLQEHREDR